MKTKIRKLRDTVGETQKQFAVNVGVSLDTVKSWECGRNAVNRNSANRIFQVYGVMPEDIISGSRLRSFLGKSFSAKSFEQWKAFRQASAAASLLCAEILERDLKLLLMAAKDRLPAVAESFLQWARQTEMDFELEGRINQVLKEAKSRPPVWRLGAIFLASRLWFSLHSKSSLLARRQRLKTMP